MSFKSVLSSAVCCLILLSFQTSFAENQYRLLAQSGTDAYDPFVDYSEFEEVSEEEADINFFRNGRFFTLGFTGGYRLLTNDLGSVYDNAPSFGLYLSYFFDLRFALQVSFLTGDHPLSITGGSITETGTATYTSFMMQLKYYINTQLMTRGLARFNPYLIGGLGQVSRTTTLANEEAFGSESATAFEFGAGVELPTLRNKMYYGFQLTYQLVTFSDENSEILLNSGTQSTGIVPTGDILNMNFVLGVNF